MAVDMFLKLDGIEGESVDSKHKGEIEVLSFSWGATQTEIQGFGSFGGGKVDVRDISFVHKIDKASPQLMFHAGTGTHIKDAVFAVRRSFEKSGDAQDFLTIKMSDLLVSSFQVGGNAQTGEIPTEQVSLNFSKIEMEYRPLDLATGRLGAPISSALNSTTPIKPPTKSPFPHGSSPGKK